MEKKTAKIYTGCPVNPPPYPSKSEPMEKLKEEIKWVGDLRDDCIAEVGNYMLRAEMMNRGNWWWCVYHKNKDGKNEEIASSNNKGLYGPTGKHAREFAEIHYKIQSQLEDANNKATEISKNWVKRMEEKDKEIENLKTEVDCCNELKIKARAENKELKEKVNKHWQELAPESNNYFNRFKKYLK